MRITAIFLSLILAAGQASADPAPKESYGLTVWGTLKYPENFKHFDYVNPDAPRGGEVKVAETGSFDSLNPFIVKGNPARPVGAVFETLMVNSLDEPDSFYGLIAKSVVVAPDRSYAEFVMRSEARFQDGSPITADDVVFSFDTLKKDGEPAYHVLYAPVASAEKIDAHRVRFNFSDKTKRELPSIVASMPILSKAYYTAHDFNKTTLEPPLGSGAYKVKSLDQGRDIIFERVKNYWGDKLPVNVGQNNFGSIRYDFYRDENVSLQALISGAYDFREENVSRLWANAYECPALHDGRLKKEVIPNEVAQGMQGFLFNVRRDKFADPRVREAIALTLDFEWMNKSLFFGAYKRDPSYFLHTQFASTGTLPDEAERKLLEPFKDELPPELFTEEFKLPVTDGSGNDRPQLIRADKLLNEAGWVIKDGRRVNAKTGEPLTLEFLFQTQVYERTAAPMRRHLKRLGIDAGIRIVDDAQYIKRLEAFDYDMIMTVYNRGVYYPGTEQAQFWHSSQADVQGSQNYGGTKSKVLDALAARIASADTLDELRPAGRALDRVLLWEHYMIPNWYLGAWRVAYWDKFGKPDVLPKYSLGFQTWWIDAKKAKVLAGGR